MKKYYVVEFNIKDKVCGGHYQLRTLADNARDAIQRVRDAVYNATGRNAFTPHAHVEQQNEPARGITGFPPAKPGWKGE